MIITKTPSLIRRIKGDLPPSGPWPASLQTLACRYWPYRYFEHCHATLGDRFTVYPLDFPPLVFFTQPEEVREILAGDPKQLHPGAGANMIAPVIGERAFMLLDENEHASARRTITPAFHQRMVAEQTRQLAPTVEREVESWPDDIPIPLDPLMRSLTLKIILKVIFGDENDILATLHDRLLAMLAVTRSLILQEPKLRGIPGWHATWKAFRQQRAEVHKILDGLATRRRQEGDPQRGDLLDMLLMDNNAHDRPLAGKEIRDNLMAMIVAGHETTTGELDWAFQLLAHNPRVQDRLIEQIDSGTEEEYLTATIHETLRRRPVFLFAIPRKLIAPIQIGDWTYKPPAHLAACTYLMHHHPDLYPTPYEFRPERFIEETRRPRTWLPWGGGRKHCLGRHFALTETKTILRQVLSTRRVLPASTHVERPRWRSAILVPHAGSRVILRRRR